MASSDELLRSAGLKRTKGRVALVRLLQTHKKPLSVSDVVAKLKGKLNSVNVYRALEALEGTGTVRRVDLGHTHAHYEIAEGPHHHHVVCSSCGKVEDVAGCFSPNMETRALKSVKSFASITSHATEFFGVCRPCAR